jgi:periplasmic divalent cation tolerance protein
MSQATEFLQVMTAVPHKADGERLIDAVVGDRLAACGQLVGPIQSVYHWQGKIERSEEWLCLLKTRAALYGELEAAIKARHPYTVPEILAVPVVAGNADYFEWMRKELKSVSEPE